MRFYFFMRGVAAFFIRLILRVRYEGVEHIPAHGGYILACNHRSNFDPVLIALKIPRQVNFFAKVELVRIPIIGRIIMALGVVPVSRGTGDTGALDSAVEKLSGGGILGIFPEGHRSKDGKPLRPRSGISIIAGRTGADVLPCAVSYPKGMRFLAPVTVRYGPLIPASDLAIDPGVPSSIKAATKSIFEQILALVDPNLPEG